MSKKNPQTVHTMSIIRYEYSDYAGHPASFDKHPNKSHTYTQQGNGINKKKLKKDLFQIKFVKPEMN